MSKKLAIPFNRDHGGTFLVGGGGGGGGTRHFFILTLNNGEALAPYPLLRGHCSAIPDLNGIARFEHMRLLTASSVILSIV